jgi:hypothetical protein
VVTAVQAWMLDPVVCAGMDIGFPRVTLSALIDLHDLLTARGFRRSSSDKSNVVQSGFKFRSEHPPHFVP